MAVNKQAALNAFARELGFASYYAYRNWRAQREGYKNYGERRAAKRTGVGLKGIDAGVASLPGGLGQERTPPPAEVIVPPPEQPSLEDRFPQLQALTDRIRNANNEIQSIIREAADRSLNIGLPTRDLKKFHSEIQTVLKGAHLDGTHFVQTEIPKLAAQVSAAAGFSQVLTVQQEQQVRALQAEALTSMKKALLQTDTHIQHFLPKLQGGPKGLETRRQAAGILNRKEGIKAIKYANGDRRTYGDYVSAAIRAATMRAVNGVYLDVHASAGVEYFMISDGEDCGLTDHRDPQKANGMLVDLKTAQQYPIAHPNCVRQFTARPEAKSADEGVRMRQRAAAAGRIAARAAGTVAKESLKATAEESLKNFLAQQGVPPMAVWLGQRMLTPVMQKFESRVKQLSFNNVVDIKTGEPAKIRPEQVARDVLTYSDNLAREEQVPEHVAFALGTKLQEDLKVVGLNMEAFNDYFNERYRFKNSFVADKLSGPAGAAVADMIFDRGLAAIGHRLSRDGFVRFSMPRLGGEGLKRGLRGGVDLKLVNASVTKRINPNERSLLKRFNLNPHGLLRAGFGMDTLTGAITPTIRWVPKGPIRVQTSINRSGGMTDVDELRSLARNFLDIQWRGEGSVTFRRMIADEARRRGWPQSQIDDLFQQARVGTGAVTSASTKVTVIVPQAALRTVTSWIPYASNEHVVNYLGTLGLDFSASINTNLRQLGIQSGRDIMKMSVSDWKKLRQQAYVNTITGEPEVRPRTEMISLATTPRIVGGRIPNFIRNLVSIMAEVRMWGGTVPDFASTLRIDWQTAKKLWNLTTLELEAIKLYQKWTRQTVLNRLYTNRPVDIQEVTHPYTYRQSTFRGGGLGAYNLRRMGLEPLQDLKPPEPLP